MSQLLIQIYKLSRTAFKAKARVVKVNHDLLHIVLQVNQSKILIGIHAKRRLCQPRVVRGAIHSGKKWRSAL